MFVDLLASISSMPWLARAASFLTHDSAQRVLLTLLILLKVNHACMPAVGRLENFLQCRLTDKEALTKARIHPLRALLAQLTILKRWDRGSIPPQLLSGLEQAFELSFASAKPTGRKFMLALDISASMSWGSCLGSDVLNCRQATAAMALIINRIEPNVKVHPFLEHVLRPHTLIINSS